MMQPSTGPVNPGDIVLNKYRVERLLGMGAMGVVVAATHLQLDQKVALKFLLPTKGSAAEQQSRFLREARAAVRLKSQHVAKVMDVGTLAEGAPYIVMEFLEGRDLGALLAAKGPLPVEEAVEYLLQVCEAAGEAHAAGIVHRDLKPANLFLTTGPGGVPCVKVLDFGVSKLLGDELKLTQTTQAIGSPLYMSPEQLRSSRDVDPRSDLWALGVILFELLGGQTPFHSDHIARLCTRVLTEEPTPLASLRPGLPAGLWAVILQCLDKDPDRRFRNAAELAAALAPFAPARAQGYVERVAAMLGASVEPARPTALLPPEAPPLEASPPVAQTAVLAGVGQTTAKLPVALELPGPAPAPRKQGLLIAGLGAVAVVAVIAVIVGAQRSSATPLDPALSAAPPSAAPASPPGAASAQPAASTAQAVEAASSASQASVPSAPAASALSAPSKPAAKPPAAKSTKVDYKGGRQ